MERLWSVPRGIAALAVISAIWATWAAAAQPVNPWNFFGYFTIQSNIAIAVALAIAAIGSATGRVTPPALRAAATTYIAVTGVVYNTLLIGLDGGVAVPWANLVLHTVIPLYAIVDWVIVADRPALSWTRLWIVIPYPLIWLAVVLVRGATDGWVPYPFLNPANGYGAVTLSCLLVTVIVLLLAALVWATSRLHLLPGPRPPVDGRAQPTRR